jgi:hypothetical protein
VDEWIGVPIKWSDLVVVSSITEIRFVRALHSRQAAGVSECDDDGDPVTNKDCIAMERGGRGWYLWILISRLISGFQLSPCSTPQDDHFPTLWLSSSLLSLPHET